MEDKAYMWSTWAEVDMQSVRHNFDTIRGALPPSVKLCCVVKANAYGHGACKLAPLYEEWGADWFAVSNLREALQLRRSGVTRPVLILGYTPASCAAVLAEHGISQCVHSAAYGRLLSDAATTAGVCVKVHIKLDTGMGRLGFQVPGDGEDSVAGAIEVCRLPALMPEGVFTHFASADEGAAGDDFSNLQADRFVTALNEFAAAGITFPIRHCANSAALSDHPECRMDMVRAGIVLYGLQPSADLRQPLALHPAMSLKSVVSHVKTVAPGATVSYGRTYCADKDIKIATVPVGYADGYSRRLSSYGRVIIRGQYAPVVGKICMDMCMVDITDVKDASLYDEVTLMGADGECSVSAEDIASLTGTISYEVVCSIGKRVPRVYIE